MRLGPGCLVTITDEKRECVVCSRLTTARGPAGNGLHGSCALWLTTPDAEPVLRLAREFANGPGSYWRE